MDSATEKPKESQKGGKVKEEPAITPEVQANDKPKSITDLMGDLSVSREEVKPAPFLDDMDFVGDTATEDGDDPNKDIKSQEQLTDDDQANIGYLDYSNEDKTVATWIIMTIDKTMDFTARQVSKDDNSSYKKFPKKTDIDEEYLDVTAALVNKYKVKLSLEAILVFTIMALYAPTLSTAYSKRVINDARTKKAANNG